VERVALRKWIASASPLADTYFRSVEYRYMDPDEVLNGAGTAALGGRFAPIGTLAVYLSATDSGTGIEFVARKARLGGSPQITLEKYPRIVFGVEIKLDRALDLSIKSIPLQLLALRGRCLVPEALSASMELAVELIKGKVQGLVFPSVVGGGENLVVYLANCSPNVFKICNAVELVAKAKRIAQRGRGIESA
jgi:RES domain-containing protein